MLINLWNSKNMEVQLKIYNSMYKSVTWYLLTYTFLDYVESSSLLQLHCQKMNREYPKYAFCLHGQPKGKEQKKEQLRMRHIIMTNSTHLQTSFYIPIGNYCHKSYWNTPCWSIYRPQIEPLHSPLSLLIPNGKW